MDVRLATNTSAEFTETYSRRLIFEIVNANIKQACFPIPRFCILKLDQAFLPHEPSKNEEHTAY